MKKLIIFALGICLIAASVTMSAQRPPSGTGNKSSNAGRPSSVSAKSINEALEKAEKSYGKKLVLDVSDSETVPKYIKSGDMVLQLVKSAHKVDDKNTDIFAENLENIYPGAIIYADDRMAMGDPTLSGLPYGKVSIRLDFNGGSSMSRDNVPNRADKIQDAIYDIINNSKNPPSPKAKYKSYYASSVAEMAASLDVNANFLKVEAKVKTSMSSNEATITHVQDYTQKYYTVSITMPDDKADLFGKGVTPDQISSKVSAAGAPLAIITSVTYGRRAYKFYDYKSSDFSFDGDESVTAYGQKASSTQKIVKKAKTKSTWMYVSGGDAESSAAILKGTDIDKAIAEKLSFDKATNHGIPLSYTVRYLGSGKTVSVNTTGTYYTVEYKPMPSHVPVTLRNDAGHVAGADMKIRLDYKLAKFKDGKKLKVAQENGVMEGYTHWVEHHVGFKDKKTFILPIGPNQYLDGPIHLQVRCKKSAGADWANNCEAIIYPTDGYIDLKINGDIRHGGKSAYIHSSSHTKDLNME